MTTFALIQNSDQWVDFGQGQAPRADATGATSQWAGHWLHWMLTTIELDYWADQRGKLSTYSATRINSRVADLKQKPVGKSVHWWAHSRPSQVLPNQVPRLIRVRLNYWLTSLSFEHIRPNLEKIFNRDLARFRVICWFCYDLFWVVASRRTRLAVCQSNDYCIALVASIVSIATTHYPAHPNW